MFGWWWLCVLACLVVLESVGAKRNHRELSGEEFPLSPMAIRYANIGGQHIQNDNLQGALEAYQTAVTHSEHPQLLNNVGVCLRRLGDSDAAKRVFMRAVAIDPQMIFAHHNLAQIAIQEDDLETSLQHIQHAIEADPDEGDSYLLAGYVYRQLGDLASAERMYEVAGEVAPNAAVITNQAMLLHDKGEDSKAVRLLQRAMQTFPTDPNPYMTLSRLYAELHKLGEALGVLRDAQARVPPGEMTADFYLEAANIFKETRKYEEALAAYDEAERLLPTYKNIHSGRSGVYEAWGKMPQCVEELKKATLANPTDALTKVSLHHFMLKLFYWHDPFMNFTSLTEFLLDDLENGEPFSPAKPPIPVLFFLAMPVPDSVIARYAIKCADYNRYVASNIKPQAKSFAVTMDQSPWIESSLFSLWAMKKWKSSDRLKLGYVTMTVKNHVTGRFMQGMFEMHNQEKYDVYLFSGAHPNNNTYRQVMERTAPNFVDISTYSDLEAARLINKMGINVNVDVDGYADSGRHIIFAMQPVPVQLSWLGLSSSTGATYLQLFVGDKIVIPPDLSMHYAEKLFYMPHVFQVNAHRRYPPERIDPQPVREDYDLPPRGEGVVFANFNQHHKLSLRLTKSWIRVLHAVNGSKLWLLKPIASPEACDVITNLTSEGSPIPELVAPPGSVLYAQEIQMHLNLQRLHLMDVFFDTEYYGAVSTATDIVFGAAPLVSRPGERFTSRAASSILTATGVPELIARTFDEYEQMGIVLGRNAKKREALKAKLRYNVDRTPMFDTYEWVRDFERGCSMAWDMLRQNVPPSHTVPASLYGPIPSVNKPSPRWKF